MPAAGRSLQLEAPGLRCSMPRGRVVLKLRADVAVLDGLPDRWRGGRGARCRRTERSTPLEAPRPRAGFKSSHSFIPRAIAYAARNEVGTALFAQAWSLRFLGVGFVSPSFAGVLFLTRGVCLVTAGPAFFV